MVFHVASLESQDKAWCYEFRGQVLDSSTPKVVGDASYWWSVSTCTAMCGP